MTTPRPLAVERLREAAEVARDTGMAIDVRRGPDGSWLYRIAPPGALSSLVVEEREQDECAAAFGSE